MKGTAGINRELLREIATLKRRVQELEELRAGYRKAEEEERHSARLSAALEMAGAICHEVNQPLQIISARIYLLSMDNTDDRTREALEMMNEQVQRIGAITRELMGLKKYSNRDYIGNIKITDIGRPPEGDAR
ncbi:MAG: Sensor protein FixL [Syntrophorhabdus sp. PtaB.Bin047]|jgi:C4-dicarboxylate-specific signal transduction histidine kinase|nr:MAG: Sensor protein FixL [Syntrophorhabdus sp. PtaB.Bin047]